jgi:predicted helicase
MRPLPLKPSHKRIAAYHASLAEFEKLGVAHETAVRSAFQSLLEDCAALVNKGRADKWKLVPEFPLKTKTGARITPDGALLDGFRLVHGLWEAKDTGDDLDREIAKKFKLGYPRDNILFQAPARAVLVQDGERALDLDISRPENLVIILRGFFEYQAPAFDEWEKAVADFKSRLPEYGAALRDKIRDEEKCNPAFAEAFSGFVALCRQALNPNLAKQAVEEMLIQHILTERIFRKIFDVGDFMQRNNIAAEIEKVAAALASRSFSRDELLAKLAPFYKAVEEAADTIPDFSEKQKFLNTVYEQFFQGFAVERADTLGIVYTPQEIVDFMLASVEEILKTEFGRSLGDPGIHVIDPFVGTGNFMVNLIRRLPKTQLEHKYRHELHCNEVMLLPYYVAAMNIEHTFYEQIGRYEAFPGICLVDTFETAEKAQAEFGFFNPENTERVKKQKAAPIFVVLGNPPYNTNQVNENDNNKNRKYEEVDRRIKETYAADSTASSAFKLGDPYVKAFRWASDRIREEGIVAYVSNNSFADENSFDGMRKNLGKDFHRIYVLDLKGNVRRDSMRDGKPIGEEHTIFGLGAMVGISICFLVRNPRKPDRGIFAHEVAWDATRAEKFALLDKAGSISNIVWKRIKPDRHHTWLGSGGGELFDTFLPKGNRGAASLSLFSRYSLGVGTNRDEWVYAWDSGVLAERMERFVETCNSERIRWHKSKKSEHQLDNFLDADARHIKWSSRLKECLLSNQEATYSRGKIRGALFRPFTKKLLYFDSILNHRQGGFRDFAPHAKSEAENRIICASARGMRTPFTVLITTGIADLHVGEVKDGFQCFPFYTYDGEEGARRENIPLSTLQRFQQHYGDEGITKWDIFHYFYAVLHHPEYRTRYAANLRRELPRIPFIGKDAKIFRSTAEIGHRLADLHVHYEQAAEYRLRRIENPAEPLNWRVEKMRLTKDKKAIIYNEFLTLSGIPEAAFAYRLGNRSALDWVIDQYQTHTDPRSGITNDPNRQDEPDYIVKLVAKVITVSLETQKLIAALPPLEVG